MIKQKTHCSLWHDLLRDGGIVVVSTYDKYNGGLSPRDALALTRIAASLSSYQPARPIEARSFLSFQPEDWDNHLVLIGGLLSNQVTRAMTESSLRRLQGSFILEREGLIDTQRPPGRNCLSPTYVPGLETNVAGAEVDYGYICIQPSPMNLSKKLYLIAGIKGWGGLAAATAVSSAEYYEPLDAILAQHFDLLPDPDNSCSLIEIIVRTEVGHVGAHGVRGLRNISFELVRIDGLGDKQWTPLQSRLCWGPRRTKVHHPRTSTQHLSLSINDRVAITELRGTVFGVRFDGSRLTPDILDRFDYDLESALSRHSWRIGAKAISERFMEVLPESFSELLYRMQSMSASASHSWIRFVTPRDYLRAPFEFLRTERDFLILEHPVFRAISNSFCVRSGLSRALLQQLRSMNEPLKVLLVASDPSGSIFEDVNLEVETIVTILKKARLAHEVDLDIDVILAEDATVDGVKHQLAGATYHILHFAGHSYWDPANPEKSGLLLLQEGSPAVLSISRLADWTKNSQLRFCYLSSCEGTRSDTERKLLQYDFLGLADGLIQMGVPEVLGYRWEVPSKSATSFADRFYRNLFLGEQFCTEQAVFRARRWIAECNRSDPTWISAVLVSQK